MKRNLLTTMLTLVVTFAMAQMSTWPITLTTADGLPGKKGLLNPSCYIFESELYKFDEATSTLRLTVVSTNTVDSLTANSYDGLSGGWGPGFPFFSLSELQVLDADGTPIEYIATSNAEAINDGTIYALNDGSYAQHFHTTYSRGECPQEYHYIELELYEAVSEFKIKWATRSNYTKNMPTYVGITPAGIEYLPYP